MSTIFIGDSIAAYWSLPFSEAINKGVPGDRPAQVADRFVADVLTPFPWCVHILIGTNAPYDDDIQVPIIQVCARAARKKGIRVILGKIPPRSYDIQPFNAALAVMAAADGFQLVDYYTPMTNADGSQNTSLFTDGTHPNAAGYAVMEAALTPVLSGLKWSDSMVACIGEPA